MPNRETIHIPNNFTRQEIYNWYKEYIQGAEGNGNFIKYAYFTQLWEKNSTTSTFLRGQGWGFVIYVLILNIKGIHHKG